MGTEITTMLNSIPGFAGAGAGAGQTKIDWVENSKADWRVDWDATSGTPPVNTVLPAITGTTTVGDVLTVSDGTWTGTAVISYTYQWFRDGVAIGGETAATHTIVSADAGTTLTATVTATNANGTAAESDTQAVPAIAPVNTVLPVITDDGTPAVGEVVTVNTGTWTGQPTPTFTYQWKNAGVALVGNGATTNSYTLQATDSGDLITCTVTATNSAGTANVTTAAITPA
jgi:hypothetical protein